ncbi:MAG TPA: helix-turn-helix domain-containing protein, partial [Skermanella sp.]|nr:helix-turn-helix domain-containing protein [Skermanella sp.]
MLRSFKYRLFPNPTQAAGLTDMLGSFCDLYNACLQQRIEAYQRRGKSHGYIDQATELKAVRLADERLAGYSYSAEQQSSAVSTKRSRRSSAGSREARAAFPASGRKACSTVPTFGLATG